MSYTVVPVAKSMFRVVGSHVVNVGNIDDMRLCPDLSDLDGAWALNTSRRNWHFYGKAISEFFELGAEYRTWLLEIRYASNRFLRIPLDDAKEHLLGGDANMLKIPANAAEWRRAYFA